MRFPFTVPPVRLRPATVEHLGALEHDRAAFAAMIGAPAPEGWPEFPEAIGFTRERLTSHPDEADWWMHLFLDPATGALLGSGGFVGPPDDGVVEIGYEIAPAFRGRRFGTGAAAALVRHAATSGRVHTVIARTRAGDNPSTRVLAALGFTRDGESIDPVEGAIWRWRLGLEPER